MQENWLCIEHGQQIDKICIDNHQCKDRRLCIDCILDNHKYVENKKMPSTQEFLNLLNEKLNDFKEGDYKEFLKTIETLQGKINIQFEKLKKQTSSVIEIMRQGDKQILELKYQLTKRQILEFPKRRLQLYEGYSGREYFRTKIILERIMQSQMSGTTQRILIKSQSFFDQEEIMTQEAICEQLEKNVKGQLLFGLKCYSQFQWLRRVQ